MPGGLSGWRFAVAAMVTFLLPLAGAMAGVAAVGDNPISQLIAAAGGLLAGAVAAVVITKCWLRPPKPGQTHTELQENK